MSDTGPTKTLAQWMADPDNPVVCDEAAFRAKYGTHADQFLDRATVDILVGNLTPPEPPPEGA